LYLPGKSKRTKPKNIVSNPCPGINSINIPHKKSKKPRQFFIKKKINLITIICLIEALVFLLRKKSGGRLIINLGIIINDPKNEIIEPMLIHWISN
jgi:hypothetical protein